MPEKKRAIIGSGINCFTSNTLYIGDGKSETVTININMPDGYQTVEEVVETTNDESRE